MIDVGRNERSAVSLNSSSELSKDSLTLNDNEEDSLITLKSNLSSEKDVELYELDIRDGGKYKEVVENIYKNLFIDKRVHIINKHHIEEDIQFALDASADYIILDGRGGGTGAAPAASAAARSPASGRRAR